MGVKAVHTAGAENGPILSTTQKRLAPVLIREVTRRIALQGVYQAAVYTAATPLPGMVSSTRYLNRPLRPDRLPLLARHGYLPRGIPSNPRFYQLPRRPNPGFRPMAEEDVPGALEALRAHLASPALAPELAEADLRHWHRGIHCFVRESVGRITGFASFLSLEGPDGLRIALEFYGTGCCDEDVLTAARDTGHDVYTCLERGRPRPRFGPGGPLHYYLYNYRLRDALRPEDVALAFV